MQEQNSRKDGVYVIGIDLGTSGPKVALVTDTGKVVAVERGYTDTIFIEGGGAEQDANQWWSAIKAAIKKAVSDAGVPAEKIVGIGTCATYSNTIPIDENGDTLMNELIWMDTRGAPHNAAAMKGFPMIKGYGLGKMLKMVKRVGIPPLLSGIDAAGHMGFIKKERPEIYEKTYKFCEPMDYITFKLTGMLSTTQGNMIASMVVDNRKWSNIDYDDELINIIGVDKAKLPDILPNDGIVGTLEPSLADELGLKTSTKVTAGSNDNLASALGAGVAEDFDSAIIVGTSLYMTGFVPFKKTDLKHLILTIPAPLKNRHVIMGVQGSGGKNMELWLENLVFPKDGFSTGELPDDAYQTLDAMAAEAPAGSNGVMFLPWVTGTIVPAENPHARAVLFNLGMDTHRSHICRAVMEGIALSNLWTKGPMEKFMGRKIKSYRLSGGGSRSNTLGQVMADALGVPIHKTDDPLSVSARGAALNTLMVLGYRKKEELKDLVKVEKTFEPDKSNRKIYDKLFSQFVEMHKRTKPVFTALNA